MAVIAVGSRPETPDVTKFFELPAVDRRFEGMVREEGGGPPYIRNSYLRWELRREEGWVEKSRFLKCDQYGLILTNSDTVRKKGEL